MSDGEGGSGGGAAEVLLGGAGAAAGAGDGDGGGAGAAAGGDAGAGAGAGGDVAGAADPDWYSNLSADPADGEQASNRDWVKSRGAKTLDDVVKGFRDTQRALHDKGAVKVPGEGATPEEVATFRKAIGVPDSVDGYKIEGPKDDAGNPLPLAEGLISAATQAALEEGLPAGPFKNFLSKVIAADLDAQRTALTEAQAEANAWLKEQGAAGAAKMAAISTAARVIGLSNDEVLAARSFWGAKRAMEIFAKLGDGLSEDVMLSGGKQRFGVTGSEAKAQLQSRMQQEGWAAKALVKGSPENAEYVRLRDASAEYERMLAGEQ